MQETQSPAIAKISRTLDALPFTRKHRKILIGSGLGWALDAMDVGLISFVLAALTAEWNITKGEAGLLASIGFAGMAVGAALGGLLADRLGRRQVFALTLLVYGLATGASALAGGLAVLIVLRFFVGLGLGAELPVASSYMSEFAPARIRGRVIVLLEAFWAVGWTLAAVIGYFVVPASADGWRWAFALGAIPALYAIVVRWALPESPRWLASRGRIAEAETIVAEFVRHSGAADPTQGGAEASDPEPAGAGAGVAGAAATGAAAAENTALGVSAGARIAALWSREFRGRTLAIWAVWFCVNFAYYGAFIWIPSILVDAGFSLVRSFGFTLIITLAQLPGYLTAAWLIERWGRRATLSAFLLGSAASATLFGIAHSETAIIAAGMALSFFNLGAWGALYAVTPELYPTTLRASGAGWAAGFGRIASIAAPLLVPVLLSVGGAGVTFAVFAAFFIIAALAAWALVERRGQTLDGR